MDFSNLFFYCFLNWLIFLFKKSFDWQFYFLFCILYLFDKYKKLKFLIRFFKKEKCKSFYKKIYFYFFIFSLKIWATISFISTIKLVKKFLFLILYNVFFSLWLFIILVLFIISLNIIIYLIKIHIIKINKR